MCVCVMFYLVLFVTTEIEIKVMRMLSMSHVDSAQVVAFIAVGMTVEYVMGVY